MKPLWSTYGFAPAAELAWRRAGIRTPAVACALEAAGIPAADIARGACARLADRMSVAELVLLLRMDVAGWSQPRSAA